MSSPSHSPPNAEGSVLWLNSARSWRWRCARSCRWRPRTPGGRRPWRGDADRPPPHRGVADDEAGGEILVFAGRHAVLDDHADHLVSGALAAIPRAVLGGEDVAAVFRRELLPGIERDAERGRMGLEQDVGHRDVVLEIGPRAAVPGIFIGTDIVPGPAVERAFPDAGDVVAGDVVAQAVALVGRAPEIAVGTDGETDAIADSRREDAAVLAVRRKLQDIGAPKQFREGCEGRWSPPPSSGPRIRAPV